MSTPARRRILIVAGGTGGHIAPALAVGAHLRATHGNECDVTFVSGRRAIELQAFASAGEEPLSLGTDKAPSLSLSALPALVRYARSFGEARAIVARVRPDAVLAMGGYVCVPVLLAARIARIPFFLHESNAIPGRVTRLFARSARCVFVGHGDAAARLPRPCDTLVSGTPVRPEMFAMQREAARAHFNLLGDMPVVSVLGGSQGARAVNEAVFASIAALAQRYPAGFGVIWCCGPANEAALRDRIAALPTNAHVRLYGYLDAMHAAYAASDLVVSRAGASTLAELTGVGVPSILIPYPHAKDNHQHFNALALENDGAAITVTEAALTGEGLATAVARLLDDPAARARMAEAARRQGAPGAASRIADILLGLPSSRSLVPTPDPIPTGRPAEAWSALR